MQSMSFSVTFIQHRELVYVVRGLFLGTTIFLYALWLLPFPRLGKGGLATRSRKNEPHYKNA